MLNCNRPNIYGEANISEATRREGYNTTLGVDPRARGQHPGGGCWGDSSPEQGAPGGASR